VTKHSTQTSIIKIRKERRAGEASSVIRQMNIAVQNVKKKYPGGKVALTDINTELTILLHICQLAP
jgi:hypothetical protein